MFRTVIASYLNMKMLNCKLCFKLQTFIYFLILQTMYTLERATMLNFDSMGISPKNIIHCTGLVTPANIADINLIQKSDKKCNM